MGNINTMSAPESSYKVSGKVTIILPVVDSALHFVYLITAYINMLLFRALN